MITIIFESHGTTLDNEKKLSSGHFDVELSELGKKQAKDLGERNKYKHIDVIFASDLQRAYVTAQLAFESRNIPVIQDARLRECNYGDLNQHPSEEVESQKLERITTPFPNGESYEQCAEKMKSFLEDLLKKYDGKTVLIIGHRATQYSIEYWINYKSLEKLTTEKFKWQPGWTYQLSELSPLRG
jgi:broad specificity phosphatase PhoE